MYKLGYRETDIKKKKSKKKIIIVNMPGCLWRVTVVVVREIK